jgi:hypothetical protein
MSLVGALLVVLSCTGCGGKSADQVLAERAVLKLSDLPSGWSAPTDLGDTVIDRCVDFDVSGLVVTGRADAAWFQPPSWDDNADVWSSSGVYEDSAGEALAQLADQTTKCLREERASGTGMTGLPSGKVKVREISLPRMGECSRAYEIKYRIGPFVEYDDILLIHSGRSLALLYFSFNEFASDAAARLMVELSEAVASGM